MWPEAMNYSLSAIYSPFRGILFAERDRVTMSILLLLAELHQHRQVDEDARDERRTA